MKTILFYVTGHGYGHAVRAAQVAKELDENLRCRVIVRTSAPEWIFPASVVVERAEVDAGPGQLDCLTTDFPETLCRFRGMMDGFPATVARETEIAGNHAPDVVVCDIAPLGVAVAKNLGVPSFVIANFLWDWIVGEYKNFDPNFNEISRWLKNIYEQATAILRTPLSGGMDDYSNVIDIPLIAKKSAKTKEDARRDLGLPLDRPLALLSFGGFGSDKFYENIHERIKTFGLISAGEKDAVSNGIYYFDRTTVAHADLVCASDVVIGKLGYGLCSEVIANGRPILYTPRFDFIEYTILDRDTMKYAATRKMGRDEFFDSSLDMVLTSLAETPRPAETPPLDGASQAAGIINKT